MKLPRHRAADDLVDELESGALRQRLHLDVAHRELAMAAGLLDVSAVAFCVAAERLSQRHAQFDGVHGDAVPAGQRVEHHAGVRLAHAPQHDLVRLGVLLDAQRRVLGGQPLQADRQLVLVGLGARLHRHRQQRLGHRPRLEHQRVGLVRQRVAGFGAAQPADRADVTRDHGGRRPLLLAERERQRADAFVLVVVGVAGRRRWTRADPKKDEKWPDT